MRMPRLTAALTKRIAKHVRRGETLELAAEQENVAASLARKWFESGGGHNWNEETREGDFARACVMAKAQYVGDVIGALRGVIDGSKPLPRETIERHHRWLETNCPEFVGRSRSKTSLHIQVKACASFNNDSHDVATCEDCVSTIERGERNVFLSRNGSIFIILRGYDDPHPSVEVLGEGGWPTTRPMTTSELRYYREQARARADEPNLCSRSPGK